MAEPTAGLGQASVSTSGWRVTLTVTDGKPAIFIVAPSGNASTWYLDDTNHGLVPAWVPCEKWYSYREYLKTVLEAAKDWWKHGAKTHQIEGLEIAIKKVEQGL
jgi:hypothetical protein